MPVIDVDGIHEVRSFARKAIAAHLRDDLLDTYRRLGGNEPFSTDAAAIGRRSLKNLALGYLMSLEDAEAVELCVGQFHNAHAMTDVIAALGLLNDTHLPQRDEALARFYETWKNEPLVVDKWFSIQAMSERPETLAEVRSLLTHPAFEIRNPNKVYALIGGFAGGNAVRFHDRSGAGYEFLGDQVLTLNGREREHREEHHTDPDEAGNRDEQAPQQVPAHGRRLMPPGTSLSGSRSRCPSRSSSPAAWWRAPPRAGGAPPGSPPGRPSPGRSCG